MQSRRGGVGILLKDRGSCLRRSLKLSVAVPFLL